MSKPISKLDLINCLSGFLGALGALAIPVSIWINQKTHTEQLEKQNRQLEITQMISQLYKANCQEKIDSLDLIYGWFEEDILDITPVKNYLKIGSDQDCKEKIQQDVNSQSFIQENMKKLAKYKIGIYYLEGNPQLQQEAKSIQDKLKNYKFLQNVKTSGKDQGWFDRRGGLSDNQIRYEKGVEDEAAAALQNVLSGVYPERNFRLQTIKGSSEDFVSIMLK